MHVVLDRVTTCSLLDATAGVCSRVLGEIQRLSGSDPDVEAKRAQIAQHG